MALANAKGSPRYCLSMSAGQSGSVACRICGRTALNARVASSIDWPCFNRTMMSSHHVDRPSSHDSLPRIERLGPERHRDVERPADDRPEELGPCDAHDGIRHAVQRQRAADGVHGTAEMPLPEPVADHCNGTSAPASATIVVCSECAPENRRNTEHLEETAADPQAVNRLRWPSSRKVEAIVGPRHGAVEQRRLAGANLFPDRVRPGTALDNREAIGCPDGKRANQQAVDQREDRRVGADAERQREDGDGREDGRLGQHSHAVTDVLPDLLEPAGAARRRGSLP